MNKLFYSLKNLLLITDTRTRAGKKKSYSIQIKVISFLLFCIAEAVQKHIVKGFYNTTHVRA